MPGVELGAAQWGAAGHDLSWPDVATAPARPDLVARSAASFAQSSGGKESASLHRSRYESGATRLGRDPATGVSPSTAHTGGSALQQSNRAIPLLELHPARGREPKIHGICSGAAGGMFSMVLRPASSGQPGSFPRLVGGSAARQHSPASL